MFLAQCFEFEGQCESGENGRIMALLRIEMFNLFHIDVDFHQNVTVHEQHFRAITRDDATSKGTILQRLKRERCAILRV